MYITFPSATSLKCWLDFPKKEHQTKEQKKFNKREKKVM